MGGHLLSLRVTLFLFFDDASIDQVGHLWTIVDLVRQVIALFFPFDFLRCLNEGGSNLGVLQYVTVHQCGLVWAVQQ